MKPKPTAMLILCLWHFAMAVSAGDLLAKTHISKESVQVAKPEESNTFREKLANLFHFLDDKNIHLITQKSKLQRVELIYSDDTIQMEVRQGADLIRFTIYKNGRCDYNQDGNKLHREWRIQDVKNRLIFAINLCNISKIKFVHEKRAIPFKDVQAQGIESVISLICSVISHHEAIFVLNQTHGVNRWPLIQELLLSQESVEASGKL